MAAILCRQDGACGDEVERVEVVVEAVVSGAQHLDCVRSFQSSQPNGGAQPGGAKLQLASNLKSVPKPELGCARVGYGQQKLACQQRELRVQNAVADHANP